MKNRKKIKNITMTALGIVLLAICSWISIAGITLQAFAIFFLLDYFGAKRGTLTILAYLLMGTIGIPVFSGFGSGIGWLAGPTGGFLFGFLFVGLLFIAAKALFKDKSSKLSVKIPLSVISLLCCYLCGACTMFFYTLNNGGSISFSGVFIVCILNYGALDAAKLVLAHILAKYMRKIKPI